jgi:hypothetical protein|tara:strand:- start:440 stop:640 length:201 start_codon:yes stop_codon:yes gene_type:complete
MAFQITATKIKRTWFLTVEGCKLPGRFKTEAAALEALAAGPEFYRYWADSIGHTATKVRAAKVVQA